MIITIKEIQNIILEEYYNVLLEVGLCHSKSTGYFTKCDKDSVYALTKKGASDNNIDSSFVGRGLVSSKDSRKAPKLKSKFGLNTSKTKQGGRKRISGDDITPKYSVSKYPERYEEELDKLRAFPELSFGINDLEEAYNSIDESDIGTGCTKCERCKGVFYKMFLNALNNATLASQGKLKKKK